MSLSDRGGGGPLVADAATVAMLLGLQSEKQFNTRRARLEGHGFPRPLPMTPRRWSIAAVTQWVIANGHAPAVAAELTPPPPRNPIVARLEAWPERRRA